MRCHLPISHRTASSYSAYTVPLAIFTPYSLLTLYLYGAACHFSTVQVPHTLSMRCYLIFLHRTASSYSVYAVLLVILAPYSLLILCLCGTTCCFCPTTKQYLLPEQRNTRNSLQSYAYKLTSLNSYKTKNSRSPPRAPAVIFILFGIICIPNKSI